MLTEEQIDDMCDKLDKAGFLRRGDRIVGPGEDGSVSLDIGGKYTTMNAHVLYALTQTFNEGQGKEVSENKLWVWNWISGGYNSCTAPTREEAVAKAREMGEPTLHRSRALTVNESTLRETTPEELSQMDAQYASMFY